MSEKNVIRLSLLLLGVAVLILIIGCSSDPVEEIVHEVEVVKEVEVTREVETVEKEVEKIVEGVAEEESEAMEDSTGDGGLQATGSEDEGGSPTQPTKGKVGANQAVEDRISWIQSTELVSNPADVRIIANKMDDVIIYMEAVVDENPTELIVTNQIKQIRQLHTGPNSVADGDVHSLFLITTPAEWDAIAADVERLISGQGSLSQPCDDCPEREEERFVVLAKGTIVILDVDSSVLYPDLEDFFSNMRQYMVESNEYANKIWALGGPE